MKGKTATSPHAAGQAEIRDERAALGGVTIAAQGFGRLGLPEIELVEERWERVTRLKACGQAQAGGACVCAGRIEDICSVFHQGDL